MNVLDIALQYGFDYDDHWEKLKKCPKMSKNVLFLILNCGITMLKTGQRKVFFDMIFSMTK